MDVTTLPHSPVLYLKDGPFLFGETIMHGAIILSPCAYVPISFRCCWLPGAETLLYLPGRRRRRRLRLYYMHGAIILSSWAYVPFGFRLSQWYAVVARC